MIKIIILSLIAVSVSCGSSTTVAENTPPMLAQSPAVPGRADIKKPSQVVEEFMALVASGELEKAKAMLGQKKLAEAQRPAKPIKPGKIETGEEQPGTLDWAAVFHDRGLRLGKVLSEKVDGDKADVGAELRVDDLKNFRQEAVFRLVLDDARWIISDVDFIFDKPSEIDLKIGSPRA
jgi:hypothetical protein